jgi:hypothetical protein
MWDQMSAVSDKIGGGEYVVGLSLLDPADPRAKVSLCTRDLAYDDISSNLAGSTYDSYRSAQGTW